MKTRNKGFTLVEIMIVVLIIGLLAALAIPSFMKARATSQKNACINSLRQIDSAKEQLAMETGLEDGDPDPGQLALLPYIKGDVFPHCPVAANLDYTINAIGTDPQCPSGIADGHVLPPPTP